MRQAQKKVNSKRNGLPPAPPPPPPTTRAGIEVERVAVAESANGIGDIAYAQVTLSKMPKWRELE